MIRKASEVADELAETIGDTDHGIPCGTAETERAVTVDRLAIVEWLRDQALSVQATVPPLLVARKDGKLIATVSLAAASLLHSVADDLAAAIRAAAGEGE